MGTDLSSPALLTLDEHLAGLARAATELVARARQTWLGAAVPTCPDWTVLDLVAHQGMVHRWAHAAVTGDRESMGNAELFETEGRTSADPIAWLERGAEALREAIRSAPENLETLVFLKQAPPPREFWARRQCHETTLHALDAVAATAGRPTRAADAWFGPDLAVDGIDELVVGFWQRGRSGIRSAAPYAVHIRPDDAPLGWVLTVSEDPVRAERVAAGTSVPGAAILSGTAVDLYLALWNRGGGVTDPDGMLARLAGGGKVLWT